MDRSNDYRRGLIRLLSILPYVMSNQRDHYAQNSTEECAHTQIKARKVQIAALGTLAGQSHQTHSLRNIGQHDGLSLLLNKLREYFIQRDQAGFFSLGLEELN